MTDKPTTLDAADLKYHGWLTDRLDTIQTLDEQIQTLTVKKAEILGARATWWAYLNETYQLGEGGSVTREGQIRRSLLDQYSPGPPIPEDPPPPHPAEDARRKAEAAAESGEDDDEPDPDGLVVPVVTPRPRNYVSPYATTVNGAG
jgi:hypothetical protein